MSRTAERLDEAVMEPRYQAIEGPHPYLCPDATYLDVHWARTVENVSALVAYAVGRDEHRDSWGGPSPRFLVQRD